MTFNILIIILFIFCIFCTLAFACGYNEFEYCENFVQSYPSQVSSFDRPMQSVVRPIVPKIMWTYWTSSTEGNTKGNTEGNTEDNTEDNALEIVPEIVSICESTWKTNAPNYTIHRLNKKTVNRWLTSLPQGWENLPPYRQSDIVRLLLLEKYGGVWIDASTVLLRNPDTFIDPRDVTFFTTPRSTLENPVFENWFISAPPNNEIIKQWASEVVRALHDPIPYMDQSPNEHKTMIGNYPYLICHLVIKNIYERDKNLFNKIKVHDSRKTAFFYHEKNNWIDLPKTLLNEPFDPDKLLVKLRGKDRDGMDSKLLLERIKN